MSRKRSNTGYLWEDSDLPLEEGKDCRLPYKLSLLRRKLGNKARQEPRFRFYALYDRIYRRDTLEAAWELIRTSKGGRTPGVDGVTVHQIVHSEDGPKRFLDEIQESLRSKSYQPRAVRRVYILKPDGRQRPLGIPTIRDRVVQMATMLILEPIFEADFLDCSYGFRPGRKAHQALTAIQQELESGRQAVYDADLKGYFDSIPHDKLMAALGARIADRSVLKLIRQWLQCPIVEEDDEGRPRVNRPKKGTPQGGVISPLLANAFLHWFDRAFCSQHGPKRWANARLVRYADDFVILARYIGTRITDFVDEFVEGRMGLEINREKTSVANLRQGDSLDFLGFTFRYVPDRFGRAKKYLNITPSKKAMKKEREALRDLTSRRHCSRPIPALIRSVNRQTRGWTNYFRFGYPRKAFRDIDWFLLERLKRHLRRRSQRPFRPRKGKSFYRHFRDLGLDSLR